MKNVKWPIQTNTTPHMFSMVAFRDVWNVVGQRVGDSVWVLVREQLRDDLSQEGVRAHGMD